MNSFSITLETFGNDLVDCVKAASHCTDKHRTSAVLQCLRLAVVIEAKSPSSIAKLIIAASDGKVLVEHRIKAQVLLREGLPSPDAPTTQEVLVDLTLRSDDMVAMARAFKRKGGDITKKPATVVCIGKNDNGDVFIANQTSGGLHHVSQNLAPFPPYASAFNVQGEETKRYGVCIHYLERIVKGMSTGYDKKGKTGMIATHGLNSTVFKPMYPRGSVDTTGLIMHITLPPLD